MSVEKLLILNGINNDVLKDLEKMTSEIIEKEDWLCLMNQERDWHRLFETLRTRTSYFESLYFGRPRDYESKYLICKILDEINLEYEKDYDKAFIKQNTQNIIQQEYQKGLGRVLRDGHMVLWDSLLIAFSAISYIEGDISSKERLEKPLETVFKNKVRLFDTYGLEFDYKDITKNADLTIWSTKSIKNIMDVQQYSIADKIFFLMRVNPYLVRRLLEGLVTYDNIYNSLGVIENICCMNGVLLKTESAAFYAEVYIKLLQRVKPYNVKAEFINPLISRANKEVNNYLNGIAYVCLYYYFSSNSEQRRVLMKQAEELVKGWWITLSKFVVVTNSTRKDNRVRGIRGKKRNEMVYKYSVLQERVIEYLKKMDASNI